MIPEHTLKPRTESNKSRTHSEAPNWTKWFPNTLRSPELNQMIPEHAPKPRTESNESRTRSEAPNWIKWFPNTLRSPELNQINPEHAPNWIKWFSNTLRSPELNQMIPEHAPKPRTESNDSRTCSEAPNRIKWFPNTLWSPELNQMIPEHALKSRSKIFTIDVKIQKWMALNNNNLFFFCYRRNEWTKSRVWVWINRIGSSLNGSLNWIGSSSVMFTHDTVSTIPASAR